MLCLVGRSSCCQAISATVLWPREFHAFADGERDATINMAVVNDFINGRITRSRFLSETC